ncbi:MAG: electron transport complex subunit RsxC [Calditrichia bacterium]
MKNTFRGGVHPDEGKHLTEHKSIEPMPLGKEFIVPLSMHIGAPADPVVNVGDEVKKGQKLAEPGGFVSVPVHSPVNGVVKKIDVFPHPVAGEGKAILIERHEEDDDSWMDGIAYNENYLELSREEMLEKVREAGLAGLGGATFPTHVKLNPPKDKPIEYLIINGAECEPYLTSDHRLMLEQAEDMLKGVQIIAKILNVQKTIIGIENNKMDAVASLEKAIKDLGLNNVEVGVFPVKYPQGAEKQLIKAAINREVPVGGLPMDVGVVVSNVGTAKAVFDAVAWNKPLISRVVTVTGDAVKEPKNLDVRIGTRFQEVLDYCGGITENAEKVIMGGPMMGMAQYSLDVPVVKGTSGILVLSDKLAAQRKEDPCILCGRCVSVCPMGLLPTTLARLSEFDRLEEAEEKGLLACVECGSCSFICPSNRYLVHYIKHGKKKVLANKKKAG